MTELRYGTSAEAGMLPEQVERARAVAERLVKEGETPSLIVLAARRGVIFLHEAFGALRPGDDASPLERDSIFPLSSLTKPITATLVLGLVEDGLIGLNRPAVEYLPELCGEGTGEILVHHLLTHTSGFEIEALNTFVVPRFLEGIEFPPCPPTQHPLIHEVLELFWPAPVHERPGQHMYYANHNYELLGEIVRRVGGRPITNLAQERVFGPLGMTDSYYVVPESVEPRIVKRAPDAAGAQSLHKYMQGIDSRQMQETPYAGGGMFSTARDLAAFGQAFLCGGRYGSARILSRPSVEAMTRNQIPGVPADIRDEHHDEASWGYGWMVESHEKWVSNTGSLIEPGTYGHGGGGGVMLWVDPPNEIVGVYLSVAKQGKGPEDQIWYLDLFQNAVTSAVED